MITIEIMKAKLHAGHYGSFRTDYSNPVDLPIPLVLSIVIPLSENCDSRSFLFPIYVPSMDTLISTSESTQNIHLFFIHLYCIQISRHVVSKLDMQMQHLLNSSMTSMY